MALKSPPGDVLELTLADIARRFKGFDVPDKPIQPADLSAADLRRFGLPPRPRPSASTDLRRVWDVAFGRELALIQFAFDERLREVVKDTPYRLASRRERSFGFPASPNQISRNWAGAYLTANRDRRFSQIWGVWTVPANLALPLRAGAPGLPFVCSNWIGLDGQRRYLDSSLPQIGTASQLNPDKTTRAQCWVQWWARDATRNVPTPLPLSLSPGDRVLCVLTTVSAQSVDAVIVNLSAVPSVGVAVHVIAPSVDIQGTPVMPNIAGATAEWIVERPSVPGGTEIFNFPNYDISTFEMCVAVESSAFSFQALQSGIPQVLHGARLIRMLEIESDFPPRIAILSLAERLSSSSVQIRYGGFR